MSNNAGTFDEALSGEGLRIAIVQARFNFDITAELFSACKEELLRLGVQDEDILHLTVPGALELPTVLQRLAASGEFDALVALGAVIKGDTYHFELVCNESAAGITRVGLDFHIPIANAVLTTYTEEQARVRTVEKGADAARTAVEMASLMIGIDENLGILAEEEGYEDADEDSPR